MKTTDKVFTSHLPRSDMHHYKTRFSVSTLRFFELERVFQLIQGLHRMLPNLMIKISQVHVNNLSDFSTIRPSLSYV